MKKFLLLALGITVMTACNSKTDCTELKGSYSTFTDARKDITKADFQIKEIQPTPESSWIKRIEYYSCDGTDGYLIIYATRSEEYIHSHVPMAVWKEFSSSSSKGSYYNTHLINRYVFEIHPN